MAATAQSPAHPKADWKVWTGRVLSALPLLAFLPSAAMKLGQSPKFLEGWATAGYPASTAVPIGIVELTCVAIYLIPRTRYLGAILLTGYLGGAISTHVRGGQSFAIPLLVGVMVWAGLFLRDGRLRELIPLAKG